MSGALDPNLASILESIRATVGGDVPAAVEEGRAPAPAAVPPTATPRGPSVEEWLAALVEPHVKAWLDANLPEIVAARVAAELERYRRP